MDLTYMCFHPPHYFTVAKALLEFNFNLGGVRNYRNYFQLTPYLALGRRWGVVPVVGLRRALIIGLWLPHSAPVRGSVPGRVATPTTPPLGVRFCSGGGHRGRSFSVPRSPNAILKPCYCLSGNQPVTYPSAALERPSCSSFCRSNG